MEALILKITGVFAFLAGLVGLFFVGKNKGTKAEASRNETKEAVRKADEAVVVVESVKEKADVQKNVDRLPDGSAAEQLRDKWSRD